MFLLGHICYFCFQINFIKNGLYVYVVIIFLT